MSSNCVRHACYSPRAVPALRECTQTSRVRATCRSTSHTLYIPARKRRKRSGPSATSGYISAAHVATSCLAHDCALTLGAGATDEGARACTSSKEVWTSRKGGAAQRERGTRAAKGCAGAERGRAATAGGEAGCVRLCKRFGGLHACACIAHKLDAAPARAGRRKRRPMRRQTRSAPKRWWSRYVARWATAVLRPSLPRRRRPRESSSRSMITRPRAAARRRRPR